MTGRTFHEYGSAPAPEVADTFYLVFGSNLAGQHVRDAALTARRHFGAEHGVAEGFAGRSYAIPTHDNMLQLLSLDSIRRAVEHFINAAKAYPEKRFYVMPIGAGLDGHPDESIAPMFADAPDNCCLPDAWEPLLAPRINRPSSNRRARGIL